MPKAVKKIVSGCLVLCLLVVLSGTTVFVTMVAYGSEKAGYMVSTVQLRKKTNTFDDTALNKKYKSYMTYGAKVWKDCGVVTLKRDKSSVNKVTTYRQKDTTVLAHAERIPDYQTGKIKNFLVKI